ncbi:MAG: type II secretion system F family protein, partial [Granulosicoccaceae bacterium]
TVVAALLFSRAMLVESFKFKVHKFLLGLPVVGKLVRSANAASFARTLSILAASGVPVLEALDIASQVIINRPMRKAVLEASGKVREGTSLSRALENSKQFPPMLLHLIASGEGSGRLGYMLEKAATHLEREQDSAVSGALGILQPTIVLVMGAAILAIVLGILLPIFELNDMVA